MKWDIIHRTRYSYASPVSHSFNEVRLKPFSNEEQTLETFLLKVLPATRLTHYLDFHSNVVHHFEINEPHTTLEVESKLRMSTHPRPPLLDTAELWPLARIGEALPGTRCFEYVGTSRFIDDSPDTWRLAVEATHGLTDTWQALLAIMRFVKEHIKYVSASTSVHTHIRDVLRDKQGVCQDLAHVAIGMCRALKIPALYVSGYLATEEASATHAWMEVYIPGLGWRGMDPTHNRQTDDQYVKIAVGRDYADVPPVAGTYRGTTERKLQVEVKIEKAE